MTPQLVLASQSPARLQVLRNAGIDPIVLVSGVDEDAIEAAMPGATPAELCLALARAKAEQVAREHSAGPDQIIVGCDSVLDVDGQAFSKPSSPQQARQRWQQMFDRSPILRTGHWVIYGDQAVGAVASTVVHMSRLTDDEMDAYLATGEPMQVAGGFTLDALGGAFVTGIEGDASNVIGISLPTLRRLLAGLGISWTSLWSPATAQHPSTAAG
ncbi:MAG: septum formation inhibitor Maf [Actinomycetales bacterium]|nr:septum formation inhibitor Maf [Actinomycetales bacterium]